MRVGPEETGYFTGMNVRVNAEMLDLLGGDPEYYETSVLPIPESLQSN